MPKIIARPRILSWETLSIANEFEFSSPQSAVAVVSHLNQNFSVRKRGYFEPPNIAYIDIAIVGDDKYSFKCFMNVGRNASVDIVGYIEGNSEGGASIIGVGKINRRMVLGLLCFLLIGIGFVVFAHTYLLLLMYASLVFLCSIALLIGKTQLMQKFYDVVALGQEFYF